MLRFNQIFFKYKASFRVLRVSSSAPITTLSSANRSPGLTSLHQDEEKPKGILKVTWKNGECTSFSSIFLRDSCRCELCYNPHSKQRTVDTVKEISLNILPKDTTITNEHVNITWLDGHESSYKHEFLWKHKTLSENIEENGDRDISYEQPVMWDGTELGDGLPSYELEEILSSDQLKYDWFRTLSRVGVTIFRGAEKRRGELDRIKTLFGGYFKWTHYGDTFQVSTKSDPSSLAYTSEPILPHIDLPHYEYIPGIQALHCIEQFKGPGAENIIIDGFNVANQLKLKSPSCYDILSKHKVTFRDIGKDCLGEFETFYERPIIGEKDGRIERISYSNWLRDYQIKGTAEEIQRFYEAYYTLTEMINDPQNTVTQKLNEGEILIFNNRRILHGRHGYSTELQVQRHLEGCYFDWDQLYWRMRPIKRRLDEQRGRVESWN